MRSISVTFSNLKREISLNIYIYIYLWNEWTAGCICAFCSMSSVWMLYLWWYSSLQASRVLYCLIYVRSVVTTSGEREIVLCNFLWKSASPLPTLLLTSSCLYVNRFSWIRRLSRKKLELQWKWKHAHVCVAVVRTEGLFMQDSPQGPQSHCFK